MLACEVLEYGVFKDDNLENYTYLKNHFEESYFLKNSSQEDLIDCPMMMLTMVSYALPKYEALKIKYVQVVEKITPIIIGMGSLLLNCRLTVMLGYYMDIMYRDNDEMFINVIKLFLGSLTAGKDELALAHQSSDTLNTIINDNDIIPRIAPILGDLLARVSECILVVKIPEFFEFVSEIFKFYKDSITEESFINMLNHLVRRILLDIPKGKSRTDTGTVVTNTTMAANKCWNIIMTIIESKIYIERYIVQIEKCMEPVFELLSDPESIGFDDDILKAMQIIINQTERVSDTMKILFPCLNKCYEKHKFVYVELFNLIQAYVKRDREFVLSSQDNIDNIFGYGIATIFSPEHTPNACVYLIQLFLMLRSNGEPSLDNVVAAVLDQVFLRMTETPMNKVTKRILYGVILASIFSNYNKTFEYLEKMNLTREVVENILGFRVKKIENPIERRLHAVVLLSILTEKVMPEVVQAESPNIIKRITELLNKSVVSESKKAKKKDSKISDFDGFDSDFDSEESEESEEEDDYRIDAPHFDEEEKKNEKDDGNSTEEIDNDEVLETEIDIQSSFAIMKTKFNSFDEFEYFQYVMKNLYANHSKEMDILVAQLPKTVQNTISGLLQTKKVENVGGSVTVHRKVVQAVRRRKAPK